MIRFSLRPLALLAVACAALSASAVTIHVESEGSRTQVGRFDVTGFELVTAQSSTPSAVDTMLFELDAATYRGVDGAFRLAFTFDGPSFPSDASELTGSWSLVSGEGDYLGFTGSGTFSTLISPDASGIPDPGTTQYLASTTIDGVLNPVPEPASLAALGLGFAAIARRRRRA